MAGKGGLGVARRSLKQRITPETSIYLGDTIGEMGLYLRLGEIAFMGKSLAGSGGQNPLEPAMTGAAILSGKAVQNFRDPYNNLLAANAVRLVRDGEMLAANVEYLLRNNEERKRMIAAAAAVLEEMRGALERTVSVLDPYIFPLTVKRDLEGH
jgi:3-deoxy-D-manno-octulosonic-acid transferase